MGRATTAPLCCAVLMQPELQAPGLLCADQHAAHLLGWDSSALPSVQARLFVAGGVDKIRLTGGEPTLRSGALRCLLHCLHLLERAVAALHLLPSRTSSPQAAASWHLLALAAAPLKVPAHHITPTHTTLPASICYPWPPLTKPSPTLTPGPQPASPTDLVELTGRLKALPGVQAVGLTSNGLTLGRKLPALKDAGGPGLRGRVRGRCCRRACGRGTSSGSLSCDSSKLCCALLPQACPCSTSVWTRRSRSALQRCRSIQPAPNQHIPPSAATAGLSLLNISLDTLQWERFTAMTRRQGHDRVLGAIQQAVTLGFDPGEKKLAGLG